MSCKSTKGKNIIMNSKGGSIVIGLLIGLAIGSLALYIKSGDEAQRIANETGRDVHQMEVISEQPGQSALTIFGPAIAGAGVGWALQEITDNGSDSSDEQNNEVSIVADYGNVNVNITGDQDNDPQTDNNNQIGDGWRVE